MLSVPWHQEINFASALLLHSCITVLLKELSNSLAVLYHLVLRGKSKAETGRSVVFDGYTSIFSRDHDGELAELYFTNTGFILLLVSLASAIAMNLTLPIKALNTLIAVTFGLTFIASVLVACWRKSFVMPIMALRRAGRFIWSDTPFVNFFSLIYIAVVLKGSSKLELRDYVIFRSIAILELVFMKARLAASDPVTQQTMLKRLVETEYVFLQGTSLDVSFNLLPLLEHDSIVPFTTSQRLFVMLCKTAVGHVNGSVSGTSGPSTIMVPKTAGYFVDSAEQHGWRIYRVSPTHLVLEDCGQIMVTEKLKRRSTKERRGIMSRYAKFIKWTHGILLRRLGRKRVVWLMYVSGPQGGQGYWRGNSNLVTGVKEVWLKDTENFRPETDESESDISLETVF